MKRQPIFVSVALCVAFLLVSPTLRPKNRHDGHHAGVQAMKSNGESRVNSGLFSCKYVVSN